MEMMKTSKLNGEIGIQNGSKVNQKVKNRPGERKEGDGQAEMFQEEENLNKSDEISSKMDQIKLQPIEIKLKIDLLSSILFALAVATRFYRLEEPRNIVFDELHYGKYVSLYLKGIFFFDPHPPLGKLLIAGAAKLAGYDGSGKFERIGSPYLENTPLFALRFIPALCGSFLVPAAYHLILQLGFNQSTAFIAGFLILCDNALLTQSRFILMESILLYFSILGIVCALKVSQNKNKLISAKRWIWLLLSISSLTCAVCVKYVGILSYILGCWILARDAWQLLSNRNLTNRFLAVFFTVQALFVAIVSLIIYLTVFHVHLKLLTKAGPHDSVMTSAFQASLEGGLASITRGQPLIVAHGSQVTLRHTHGRTCWLHSHPHVYPVRYADKRGSSHQQQVTCYSFKDVNNWWILKRPEKNDLVVSQPVDPIKHGDVIQIVHGITVRALNSHDVAAPVSPQNQEVSCYIDYNVSMPAQNLWTVDIVNREQVGDIWHAIQSQVRLVHVNSSQALKFTGRQLPDWGFNQHEVVTDKVIGQLDTVWNVEEHRYTKNEDQKEREMELVNAEMIPMQSTTLGFWPKFLELQYKMLFGHQESLSHMYASEPLEWPLMTRTIAYWIDNQSNAQIHLVGNIIIWWSGVVGLAMYTFLLIGYLLRRRRLCFDIVPEEWDRFVNAGQVLLMGFGLHYFPYFFMDRTMFLHNYLPALMFKIMLLATVIQHFIYLSGSHLKLRRLSLVLKISIVFWCYCVIWAFKKLLLLSYGSVPLSTADLLKLRWRESWHFILHRE